MKRKEGIIKRWELNEFRKPVNLSGRKLKEIETRLVQSEYNNYVDLCYYCYEEPLTFTEWSEQIIKPAKQ